MYSSYSFFHSHWMNTNIIISTRKSRLFNNFPRSWRLPPKFLIYPIRPCRVSTFAVCLASSWNGVPTAFCSQPHRLPSVPPGSLHAARFCKCSSLHLTFSCLPLIFFSNNCSMPLGNNSICPTKFSWAITLRLCLFPTLLD